MNTHDTTPSFFEAFAKRVIRYRWLVATLIVAVTALFFTQFPKLTFNTSFKIWFFENDPAMSRLAAFKKAFGNDAFVYLMIETDGVFRPETATTLKNLATRLEKTVPYLKSLTWVGNAEIIEGKDDTILIHRLLENIPDSQTVFEARQARAVAEEEFLGRYISMDGKTAGILLEFDPFPEGNPDGAPSAKITTAVSTLLDSQEFSGLNASVVGDPIFEAEYTKIANAETPRLFMICLAVQTFLLLLFIRSVRGILAPLLIVTLSFLWVLGSIALLGFELDLMIIGLPVLLVCIGIGDSMHAMTTFSVLNSQGVPRHDALARSMGKIGLACLVTSLTTAAGFMAFGAAPVKPFLRMGVYMPLGVIYAYILTVLLVPVLFSFGKVAATPRRPNPLLLVAARLMDNLSDVLIRHPCKITLLFAALMALSLVGTAMLQVESNTARYLSASVPLRQYMDAVDAKMAGSSSLEIVLDTGRPDGIKTPSFLRSLDALQQRMEGEPLVNKTLSICTVLKKIRRAMHNDDPAFYALPETPQSVAEYLAMYELSGGENLNKLVSLDSSTARLTLQTKSLSSKDTRQLMDTALAEARKLYSDDVTITPSGMMDIAKSLNDNMGSAQRSSISLAFALIGIVMMIALRSVKLGLISLLPNLLPVFATLGFMGFAGIDMDTILMTVCGMVIGVSVDDTTHIFMRFRQAFAECGNYKRALRQTLHAAGYPVLFTTVTLCLGFLTLLPSVLMGWVRIGFLAPFAFAWALIGDLVFAGPLLLLFKPLGKERNPD